MQSVLEKSMLPPEGYHPSLLIDPNEKISPPPPPPAPVEALKNLKFHVEKKEEIKTGEGTRNTGISSDGPSIMPQQSKQSPQVLSVPQQMQQASHSQETFPVVTPNPRMRVASNLPPHLEQQLQQHSMMRNTAPRQQHQQQQPQTGVRMVRSGSGTTWRAVTSQQQQQIILQRSMSQPTGNQGERPQQQLVQVRPGFVGQQIRAPGNQTATVSGMVRQVRLVNPALHQQQLQQHQQLQHRPPHQLQQQHSHVAGHPNSHPPSSTPETSISSEQSQQPAAVSSSNPFQQQAQQPSPHQRMQLLNQSSQGPKMIGNLQNQSGDGKLIQTQTSPQNMQNQMTIQQQQQLHHLQQQQIQQQQFQKQQQLQQQQLQQNQQHHQPQQLQQNQQHLQPQQPVSSTTQIGQHQQIPQQQCTQTGQQHLPNQQQHNFQQQRYAHSLYLNLISCQTNLIGYLVCSLKLNYTVNIL